MMNLCSFIQQYIFPGAYLPSATQLVNHIVAQSNGTLTLERIENIGGHYVKTLRVWRENFQLNFDDRVAPALLNSRPGMSREAIEVFRRKWEVRIFKPPSSTKK
jgi:cyclopropane-fatty-acyl-phospholipid synthase